MLPSRRCLISLGGGGGGGTLGASVDPLEGRRGRQAHCKKGCLPARIEEHGPAGLPRRHCGQLWAFLTLSRGGGGLAQPGTLSWTGLLGSPPPLGRVQGAGDALKNLWQQWGCPLCLWGPWGLRREGGDYRSAGWSRSLGAASSGGGGGGGGVRVIIQCPYGYSSPQKDPCSSCLVDLFHQFGHHALYSGSQPSCFVPNLWLQFILLVSWPAACQR